MQNILDNIMLFFTTLTGGGLLGYLFEKRKRKAETQLIEADLEDKISEAIREMYLKFVEDFNQKYDSIIAENHELQRKYGELMKENELLNKELKKVLAELKRFQKIQIQN